MLKTAGFLAMSAGWAVLSAGAALAAETQPAVELAGRFMDARHGYSLCPPAGSERVRQTSPLQFVEWRMRDAKSNAIVWTLSVARGPKLSGQANLDSYAKLFSQQLASGEGFQVESAKAGKFGVAKAVDIRGVTGGERKFYHRQACVVMPTSEFLVFRITGPVGLRNELDGVFDAAMGTLEIIDPASAQKRREAALAGGKALLAGLTDEKFASVVREGGQWFLFKVQDKPVGFMHVVEASAERDNAKGVEVSTVLWLRADPKQPITLARTVLFATADRKVEKWSRRVLAEQAGRRSELLVESGVKSGANITCSLTGQGGASVIHTQTVPAGNVAIYLPQAMDALLPRLVDLSKPGVYGFAVYNSQADGFDLRTLTVGAAQMRDVDGKQTRQVHLTHQIAEDADAQDAWVDLVGNTMSAEAGEKTTLIPASQEQVTQLFPNCRQTVAELSK